MCTNKLVKVSRTILYAVSKLFAGKIGNVWCIIMLIWIVNHLSISRICCSNSFVMSYAKLVWKAVITKRACWWSFADYHLYAGNWKMVCLIVLWLQYTAVIRSEEWLLCHDRHWWWKKRCLMRWMSSIVASKVFITGLKVAEHDQR